MLSTESESQCLPSHNDCIGLSNAIIVSYTIFIFICSFIFNYLLDSMMPQHLVPYSVTNNLCHSVLPSSIPCPPSILCHLITPLPLIPIFHLLFSLTTCPIFCLPTPCSFVLFLSLSSQHPFITPCLSFLTLST